MAFRPVAALLLLLNAVAAWQQAGVSIGDLLKSGTALAKREAVKPTDLYPEHTISIPIDHFHNITAYEPHSDGVFPNRYWFDASHYKEGGPIFVLASGETSGVGRLPFLQKGLIAQLAQANNGIAVVLEHRYYGTSIPTEDFSTENLRWLTHEQAMADTAFFARNIKFPGLEHLDLTAPKNPWILYGGSYAGAFVAFLRVTYPDLFWGAISSSGVTEAIFDFWQYYEAQRNYGPKDCVLATQELTAVVDTVLLKKDSSAISQLKKTFYMANITHDDDFANALSAGVTNWQSLNWDPKVSDDEFFKYCNNITSKNVLYPETESLRSTVEQTINSTGYNPGNLTTAMLNYIGYTKLTRVDSCTKSGRSQDACFGNYNVTFYEQDSIHDEWRLWPYQYCTQWGYLQTGSGVPATQLPLISRLIDIPYSSLICKYAFNITEPSDVEAINKFGGFNISYPRLAIIDGEADPWKQATPHADVAPPRQNTIEQPFVVIAGLAVHHWDENGLFKNETTADLPPKPVKKAQSYERSFVKSWLQDWEREKKGGNYG
ncbi:hypothetical protein EJ05DRAFT_481023 [Pseudovirgaria hyperparasitica]|uniref:Peptidase S28 n=1 Tax=Pseudovirgaria hyperparasitica TaxID=470096 RepID=A0A6A6VT03_9PEZI|nr:uncharacterized protein EJ05DRAFT_481023 [Pseudovirgaria hyperparasitica]KAF2752720.1 hypothetical protein EJ05DRAFT_481023 [Pseudovirgaria hyperparasitica]